MEKFNKIYPFTTENIAGYMSDLDFNDKKIVTVTGSSDHILNAVLKGCKSITTFDLNDNTKRYLNLKIASLKKLEYEEFLSFLLINGDNKYSIKTLEKLKLDLDTKDFWKYNLIEDTFNYKYFDVKNKICNNLYLNKEYYDILKKKIVDVEIVFKNKNITDLVLQDNYDYMFLSNISDYLNNIYKYDFLNNYKELIFKFLNHVKTIYFAYIYDINSNVKRSEIDDIEKVKKIFGKIKTKDFKTALINQNTYDRVYIKEE